MESKKYNDRDRVTFKNVNPWSVSFAKILMPGAVVVEPYREYKQLTYQEIEEQINAGNSGFLGTDGLGNHAPFQFVDLDAYNALFQQEAKELPEYLSEEKVRDILKLNNQDKLEKAVKDIVQTNADKRHFMNILDRMDADDIRQYPGWKISMLEKIFNCEFSGFRNSKTTKWRGRFGE